MHWRKMRMEKKRTHNEASNVEDMTFTKPEIGKKKKKAVKPSTRNYDPRPKAAVNSENLVEQFRGLLINKVPSAVGLHLLRDPGLKDPSQPHLCYCLQYRIWDRITRRTREKGQQ